MNPCAKCGGTDIYVRWIHPEKRPANDALSWRAECGMRNAEHLHSVCRSCGYWWDGECADASPTPKEDAPRCPECGGIGRVPRMYGNLGPCNACHGSGRSPDTTGGGK